MFLHPSHTVVLVIYVDPTLFVLATSIIVHGLGLNSSHGLCEGAIILCLVCYMTTKIVIYYFLVERAYVVRGSRKPRLKTKLWLFNCLSMMLPYTVFVIMNFIWRITYISEKGVCIIGMQKIAMLPLITFEVVVNIYLTLLFILPLRSKPPPPRRLRRGVWAQCCTRAGMMTVSLGMSWDCARYTLIEKCVSIARTVVMVSLATCRI